MTTKRTIIAIAVLKAHFENGIQMFNTRNVANDEMESLYADVANCVYIDVCKEWGYVEIFGLTEEEFKVVEKECGGSPYDFYE